MNRLDKLLALRAAEPTDPEVHYMIAMERAKEGDTAQAVAGFDECIRLAPDFSYAYYHKAVTLDNIGKREEALAVAEEGAQHAGAANDEKAHSELSGLIENYCA